MDNETQINEIMPGCKLSAVNNNDVKAVMDEVKSTADGSDDTPIDMINSVSFFCHKITPYQ